MKKIYLILISLTISSSVANNSLRQQGLILPVEPENYDLCCIFSPQEGFEIFNAPNGKKIGVLTRNTNINKGSEPEYQIYFVNLKTNTATKIEVKNFIEVGYEIFAIPYFERRNGFIRIINESVDFWIPEKDITDKKFKLVNWQQFFIENADKFLGFYAKDPGLQLKAKPTICSMSIIELESHLFQITPTNEVNDNWTKVTVKKYKEHPCANGNFSEDNLEFTTDGWLQIITQTGDPNLWFYPRGC